MSEGFEINNPLDDINAQVNEIIKREVERRVADYNIIAVYLLKQLGGEVVMPYQDVLDIQRENRNVFVLPTEDFEGIRVRIN